VTREALAAKTDVRAAIFDRPVRINGGRVIGKAHDLVIGVGGGVPQALVVILGDGAEGAQRNAVAVPWAKVVLGASPQPIVLSLDDRAVAGLPAFAFVSPPEK